MQLSRAASITAGALTGEDAVFHRVSIDSRQIEPGDLFVAIPGERFDGHDFITRAGASGAVGALVSRPSGADLAEIRVDDTTHALGRLGSWWRDQFDIPVLAITGSNGKTTVTAMLAAILGEAGPCLHPRGSFNNQWGVPLTLLHLREEHRHAVIEMGMNHPGELDYLTRLVKPDLALVNNIAGAHLEGLGSLERVAAAKSEIFRGLPAAGIAVINGDDDFYDFLAKEAGAHRIVRFGLNPGNEVSAENVQTTRGGSRFDLVIEDRSVPVSLPLLGRHNVMNAIAAAAAAQAVGAPDEQIVAGLGAFRPVKGRLFARSGSHGGTVLDDSYNANPASTRAALEVLASFEGTRVAALGRMGELGPDSEELHREVGMHARRCGIDELLTVGGSDDRDTAAYLEGFGKRAERFADTDALVAALAPRLGSRFTVLVKGSRAAGMERVVAGLLPEEGATC